VRRAYVEALVQKGFEQRATVSQNKEAIATLQLAMRTAAALGGRDITNLEMAAYYAEAGGWLLSALIDLGRNEEARRVGSDAEGVADKVLELRPGYLLALHAQQLIVDDLAGLALNDLRPAEAEALGKRSVAVSLTLIKLDPKNIISFSNLAVARNQIGDADWQAGRPRESLDYYRQGLEDVRHASKGGASFVLNNTLFPTVILAVRQADLGDTAAVDATLGMAAREMADLRRSEPNSRILPLFGECLLKYGESGSALLRGDATTARRAARECVGRLQSVTPHGALEEFWKTASIFFAVDNIGQAEYMLGDPAAAERSMRTALELHKQWPTQAESDRRDEARLSTLLAMSLAREGRAAEAKQVIGPVVKFHRGLAARNHGDEWQHVEYASALYAQALADKRQRPALLKEAAALIAAVPAQMRDLHSVRLWRDRIRQELHARTAAVARGAADRVAG
jgi:tetratricopeptide (TPR) repeat protein